MREIKLLEGAMLLLASAICARSSPAAWHVRNSSAEWERQHRSKLLSSAMLPLPKGEKFAWGFFFVCFFKNPYLQTSDLYTRITPRIILKVLKKDCKRRGLLIVQSHAKLLLPIHFIHPKYPVAV